ncbi:hypothetical protein BU16DRAFT_540238 [Lophium mytilinum]|uniref:F-box domain-containing protein n=1 Tax=Lophium mytilinum TaxID=390894 RepID=A0A6A6QSR4_9PEZI|nr:hypothetical protein BU16DRAFT_540238 [Lophium mytilinum]
MSTSDANKTSAGMPASERVGHIVELVENIFQYLPFSEVISASRVCKQWRDIIDGSLPIQQKLFFVPLSEAPTLRVPGFLLPKSAAFPNDAVYRVPPVIGRQWHPMLLRMLTQRQPPIVLLPGTSTWCLTGDHYGQAGDPRFDHLLGYFDEHDWVTTLLDAPAGKWQRALCCQPPIFTLTIKHDMLTGWKTEIEAGAGSQGITMLQIQEYVRDLVKRIKEAAKVYENLDPIVAERHAELRVHAELLRSSLLRWRPIELALKLLWCEGAFGTELETAGTRWIMQEADDGTVGVPSKLAVQGGQSPTGA